jgi:hypothetical protein
VGPLVEHGNDGRDARPGREAVRSGGMGRHASGRDDRTMVAVTPQKTNTLNFPEIGKMRGWKDAFVAQIASSPRQAPTAPPVAAAALTTPARG